ncbi:MAG: S8 family peptidase [Chromatiaceae bacterium]|nr:S8 family peptidase [Chromatiaceae bacterium]
MANGDRLPLLLFQEPVPATKTSGGFGRPKFNKRSRQEVAGYLDPKLSRLDQALESERIRIQASAAGIEPEMVLVIELATEPSSFAAAARAIGLEWLAEDEIDIDPSDAIHPLNAKGKRQDKRFQGRLFLTMTDRRALDELLSRWRKWRDQPEAAWPYGETAWRDIFPLIVDIRPWGIDDRLQETGVLEDLAERMKAGEESIPFEAELWYRQTAERRALAEGEVGRLVRELGGTVTTRFQLKDIRYHALVGEVPVDAVSHLLTLDRNVELLRCNDVWLFRPVGQCALPLIFAPEAGETAVSPAEMPDPALPPIVALLDGVPLAGHELLEDRLIIDDPDGFEADAKAEQRMHGTSMASLILHGEIEATEDPLPRRIYCRPIMVPQVTARNSEEHIPDNVLPVDLIHRAVRRLFEGEGETDAQAPEVRIISLSVGDPARPFLHGLSPWARLLDWLSYQYGVLFVVSAGNHADAIDLDIPKDAWSNTDAETREVEILRALKANARNRRILSPAESINALTVGAAHADACPQGLRASYHCDPFKIPSLASPISANGLGFLRAIKPEILMPGGRQIYEEALGAGGPHLRLVSLKNRGPPGQKTAVPSPVLRCPASWTRPSGFGVPATPRRLQPVSARNSSRRSKRFGLSRMAPYCRHGMTPCSSKPCSSMERVGAKRASVCATCSSRKLAGTKSRISSDGSWDTGVSIRNVSSGAPGAGPPSWDSEPSRKVKPMPSRSHCPPTSAAKAACGGSQSPLRGLARSRRVNNVTEGQRCGSRMTLPI